MQSSTPAIDDSAVARRLAALTRSAVDAIVSADGHGLITDWNPAAERMFGYGRREVLGEPLELLMPERFRAAHRAGLERMVARRDSRALGRTVELSALHRDGHEFPIELSLSSWDVDGAQFFTGVIRDISERKRLEDKARRYAEALEARNRALTEEQQKLVASQAALTETVRQLEDTFSMLADLLAGHVLAGRYHLEYHLRSDAVGALYEGVDVEQGAPVYVRVLRCAHAARCLEPSIIAAAMDLPHAPEVLDAGVADVGLPFVVIEPLSGESLSDRMARRRPTRREEALAWIGALADSLATAHDRGMVHGRLTPHSLFFHNADTPDQELLVLDFEVAGLERAGHCLRPSFASDLGRYCAPESRGSAPQTAAGDVFGAATLLMDLTVGHVREEDAEWALAEHAPPWLHRLVRACRDPEPGRRPAASALATAVREGSFGGEGDV